MIVSFLFPVNVKGFFYLLLQPEGDQQVSVDSEVFVCTHDDANHHKTAAL